MLYTEIYEKDTWGAYCIVQGAMELDRLNILSTRDKKSIHFFLLSVIVQSAESNIKFNV